MFNKDSAVVKIWILKIKQGDLSINQVPDISNLKAMVKFNLQES